jgi:hypothetical protein
MLCALHAPASRVLCVFHPLAHAPASIPRRAASGNATRRDWDGREARGVSEGATWQVVRAKIELAFWLHCKVIRLEEAMCDIRRE